MTHLHDIVICHLMSRFTRKVEPFFFNQFLSLFPEVNLKEIQEEYHLLTHDISYYNRGNCHDVSEAAIIIQICREQESEGLDPDVMGRLHYVDAIKNYCKGRGYKVDDADFSTTVSLVAMLYHTPDDNLIKNIETMNELSVKVLSMEE